MSAYVVSKKTIDAIVYAYSKIDQTITGELRDKLGQMLWDENFKSVNYRYRENTEPEPYTYERPDRIYGMIQLLGIAGCYDYQACEHPEYKDSAAHKVISMIYAMIEQATGKTVQEIHKSYEYQNETMWGVKE